MAHASRRTIEAPASPEHGDRVEAAGTPCGRAAAARTALSADSIDGSMRTVDEAVERLAVLREGCSSFRELAIELSDALDDERERSEIMAQRLAEIEHLRRTDHDRIEQGERQLGRAARRVGELEHQLATVNAQALRLVQTVAMLMSAGQGRASDLRAGAGTADADPLGA